MELRVGIIGCGAIYSTHAEGIRRIEGLHLAGFYDEIPARSEAASLKFDAPSFSRLSELSESCDAVCVCVPSGLHARVGIEAARLGKHVLVEKPIDVSLEAAEALVWECRKANVKLSIVSQHRFAPDIQRLQALVSEGLFGEALQGDAYIKWYRTQHYYDSGEWRGTWKLDGGGCLINQGIHYIDMIQWVMGGVKSVQAQVRTAAHAIEVEDVAAALIEYKNGALGVIQGSTSFFPGFAERLEVHLRHASVVIEGDAAKIWELDEEFEGDDSPYGRGVRMQPTPKARAAERPPLSPEESREQWIEQHRLQIEDFANCIREDREPFITGEMALEPLKVVLAIYESARNGGIRTML